MRPTHTSAGSTKASALLSLLLATALAPALAKVESFRYVPRVVEHARFPISEENLSLIQCASRCHLTANCLKFSHDRASSFCQLWPIHSPTNPLTTTKEPLHQPRLPTGFTLSLGSEIAYKFRTFRLRGGRDAIVDSCRQYDPDSRPANPRNSTQLGHIQQILPDIMPRAIGIWKDEGDVYRDMVTGEVVTPVTAVSASYNYCLILSRLALRAKSCDSEFVGHICEYYP